VLYGCSTHTTNRAHARFADNKPQPAGSESVAAILTRCKTPLIADWLKRTKGTPQLNHLRLSDQERTGHLPQLVDDIVIRLAKPNLPTKDSDAIASPRRRGTWQSATDARLYSAMLIHESRILQRHRLWNVA